MVSGAPPDWQLGFAKAEQRLGYLLTYELWSDCIFVVGSETNPEIRAHKLVLAMATPIFEAMFFGLMQRIGQRIYIPDVQPEAFRALLQYIYTGDVNIGSLDKAYDLLDCAKKYKLLHLENKCNDYICTVGGSRNSGGDAARAGSNIVRSTRPHAPPALDKEILEAQGPAQTDRNEKSGSEPRSKDQSTSRSDKAPSSAPPMSAPYQESPKTASMDSPFTLQPQHQLEAAWAIDRLCSWDRSPHLALLADSPALEPYCQLLLGDHRTCRNVLRVLAVLLRYIVGSSETAPLLKLQDIGVPQLLLTVREGENTDYIVGSSETGSLLKLQDIGVPQLLLTVREGENTDNCFVASDLLQTYFSDGE